MAESFRKEKDFEDALVEVLTRDKGWTGGGPGLPAVLVQPDEAALVDNWAQVLFENNDVPDRLNGCPLTEGERAQLLDQVRACTTPAEANLFINGGTATIKRDNADDARNFEREVGIEIFNQAEVAGGSSVYQIARQPRFAPRRNLYPSRRGDLMLLINGLPVIHVELKRSGVDVSQAVHQIEKYLAEDIFSGFFSLLQIFVAANPETSRYFANPGSSQRVNSRFLFRWADRNNEPDDDWRGIAEHLLSIPMAHKMVSFYTVADSGDGQLKVMRSYQYWAISAIERVVRAAVWDGARPRGGYVWHTTGSGKTLTSFKAAQLIARRKLADKIVFLVDRIELGTQSLKNYRSFASPADEVNDTESARDLLSLLLSDAYDDALIVTSIQKMGLLCKDEKGDGQLAQLAAKRVVVIVDECHRSVFGEMMIAIKKRLPHALLIGFSGTPIEVENSCSHKNCTTADVFGDELARYTMADGIHDGNVLGFDITQCTTYTDDDLRECVALAKAKATSLLDVLGNPEKEAIYYRYKDDIPMAGHTDPATGKRVDGIEDLLPNSQYDRDEHRSAVVRDIAERWDVQSRGSKFHAILATSSIREAISYFRLFRLDAPQLKVTALFDPSDGNEEFSAAKLNGIGEILADYNARYDQHFTISDYARFKEDVAARLAHKRPYLKLDVKPEQALDLLIVVDQMLTGFDSKWVNALYLDKMLKFEHVIQAFSRTNRIFGPGKPFGAIRFYRKPHTMRSNIDAAVRVYSGDRPAAVFVNKIDQNIKRMNELFVEIRTVFEGDDVGDFTTLPSSCASREKFAKLFHELSAALDAARLQGFDFSQMLYDLGPDRGGLHEIDLEFSEDDYLVLALRYKDLFSSEGGSASESDVPYEIDTHLLAIDTTRIDDRYLDEKFDKWLDLRETNADPDEVDRALNDLHTEFAKLSAEDQTLATGIIDDLWAGQMEPQEGWSFRDHLNARRAKVHEARVQALVDAFGIDRKDLLELLQLAAGGGDVHAYSRLDNLIGSADRTRSKATIENVLGHEVKARHVTRTLDRLVRRAIEDGLFDLKGAIRAEFDEEAEESI